MTDQPRRASASDLRAAVLAWWAEHECDTGSADAGDGYSEEYNIYDEPPQFVQIAQGMAESSTSAQPVEAAGDLAATAFICHLIDNHEGEKVTEESLQSWMAEALAHTRQTGAFDFAAHLHRQRDWSGRTFGPGSRAQGVVDHIRKELKEIEADPADLKEWIDVVILALDGAWRSGAQPQEIIDALVAKQTKNEGRVWPDWRTSDPNKAIEHDRSHDVPVVDQAGEVVEVKWPGPWNRYHFPVDAIAKVFGKAAFEAASILRLGPPNHSEIGIALLQKLGQSGFGVCRDAQPRPVGVPDGWKLVPVKAMREITEAGRKSLIESSKANVTYDTTAAYAYEEMVAAAPAPGKGGEA